MYVLSPWSKGGWVSSQVFDHTSVLRFIEARFGVAETNISPWRRAVCGDLTSLFNFADPDDSAFFQQFPETQTRAERARALSGHKLPILLQTAPLPRQASGVRPSRALPYELHTHASIDASRNVVELQFVNSGTTAAVFHVYDRRHLHRVPHRYTVEAGKQLRGQWFVGGIDGGFYDLWVLGPNGYHRSFCGNSAWLNPAIAMHPEVLVEYQRSSGNIGARIINHGQRNCHYRIVANAYFGDREWDGTIGAGGEQLESWALQESGGWYDFSLCIDELPGFARRFAGRVETGRDSISDPRMGIVSPT